MRLCVIFYNLGGYHLARLAAAFAACRDNDCDLQVIEIVRTTSEHPWGELALPEYVRTLTKHQPGNVPSLPNLAILESALNQINPDAVAIPGWGHNFARHALKWCRQRRKPAILMSESKRDDAPRSWLKEAVKRWAYVARFDAALVGGSRHREYLTGLGMPSDSIFTGYDVVDNEFFVHQTDSLRTRQKKHRDSSIPLTPFFLSSNRFIERKNLLFLIDSFDVYRKQMKSDAKAKYDLVLLGGGILNDDLRSLVRQRGLENAVHFPGFVPYAEICQWYAAASAFVHPARGEQWGLVVNEAMAAGLPILLSRACGCFPELLKEGLNGFSFDPTNEEELAFQMETLSADEDLRTRMGQVSREHIQQNYSPEHFGQGLVAAINAAR